MDIRTIEPIAHIRCDFKDKFGVPRQSGVSGLEGRIVFEPKYNDPEALKGLEGFSHVWLIFGFSNSYETFKATVRPPRLGGNKRMGVFATRSPYRPNSLGLSAVRLVRIEDCEGGGKTLIVDGVDLLDGTAIYDIKPYVAMSDCIPQALSGFADEVKDKDLAVQFPEELLLLIPKEKRVALVSCLSQDPRPSYHMDDREYGMCFCGYNVRFRVNGNKTLIVLSVEPIDGE